MHRYSATWPCLWNITHFVRHTFVRVRLYLCLHVCTRMYVLLRRWILLLSKICAPYGTCHMRLLHCSDIRINITKWRSYGRFLCMCACVRIYTHIHYTSFKCKRNALLVRRVGEDIKWKRKRIWHSTSAQQKFKFKRRPLLRLPPVAFMTTDNGQRQLFIMQSKNKTLRIHFGKVPEVRILCANS